jgi:LTXXQ motif family protein
MMAKASMFLASVALGVLCLTTGAVARGGGHGGGGHGGGGHFGGGHFGRGHFGGGGHFGGRHFGGARTAHFGGAHHAHVGGAHRGHVGGARLGHLGGARSGHAGGVGVGHDRVGGANRSARFHGFEGFDRHGFNRNGFGTRQAWNRWGGRNWGAGWHRWGAGWGGWAGAVFWPYLYGDVLSYLFWPDDYYDSFWAYGPDFFLSSIFWPGPYYSDWAGAHYDGMYNIYGAGASTAAAPGPGTHQQAASSTSDAGASCSGLAPGVTNVPIERIQRAVHPTSDQANALDDLKSAASRASDIVKASCPTQVPLTPPARLDAVEKRLNAMIQAVQTVREPLERFYDALSDAQMKRLAAVGASAKRRSSGGLAALCDPRAQSFVQLPVDRIEQTIRPTEQQKAAFDALKSTSVSAASALQASCPATTPANPVDRIDAVEKRLDVMVRAAQSVGPALDAFYATLSDDQKARFNVPQSAANTAAP